MRPYQDHITFYNNNNITTLNDDFKPNDDITDFKPSFNSFFIISSLLNLPQTLKKNLIVTFLIALLL